MEKSKLNKNKNRQSIRISQASSCDLMSQRGVYRLNKQLIFFFTTKMNNFEFTAVFTVKMVKILLYVPKRELSDHYFQMRHTHLYKRLCLSVSPSVGRCLRNQLVKTIPQINNNIARVPQIHSYIFRCVQRISIRGYVCQSVGLSVNPSVGRSPVSKNQCKSIELHEIT